MIHLYDLHGGAPRENWLRWSCKQCGRVVDQDRATGTIVVQTAGADLPHGGHAGQHHVFDWQLEIAPVWERALEGLEFR